jgi:hypothetical protein
MTVPRPAGRPDADRTADRTHSPGGHGHRRLATPEHHPDQGLPRDVLGRSAPGVTSVE